MKDLVFMFRNMTLKGKMMITFISLIVLPSIILGYFSIRLYYGQIQNIVIKSAIQGSDQVVKNLDTFLGMLSKLSEYPIKDQGLRTLLTKDYTSITDMEYEKGKDFNNAKELLYYNIKSFSDMIDSVLLYRADTFEIRGRTPTDSLNLSYNPSGEEWTQRILDMDGACTIIGIHKDLQQRSVSEYVVSVGRSIVSISPRKSLGFIIINVGADKLESLWSDTNLTPNSRFYLIDENDNIIFSKDRSQLNKSVESVLGVKPGMTESGYIPLELQGQKLYMISSVSKMSGWKVINIIPQDELFVYFNRMFNINIMVTVLIIILAVVIAILFATGITRPLSRLNQKMKQIGKGNFDIEIEKATGEVGEISRTVEIMIGEVKRLISRIYKDEEEKRTAEMVALQAQINPHFLYNTLNNIKWMANIQGAESIENALGSLSSLFSFIVRAKGDYIPIEEEVSFVRDYLAILNLRYYNRFTVTYDIDEEVYRYKTLKFLLQPIIENAVFHGIEGVERKGLLKVGIHHEGNTIIFTVEDNGKGISNEKLGVIFEEDGEVGRDRLNSIGIPNIQKRIKLHFGENYGISIRSMDEQGTVVTIAIPAMALEN